MTMPMHPVISESLINQATETLLSQGMRIFQGARMASTDEEHVAALLRMMNPPNKAIICDIGCGVGEVARIMREQRKDLAFLLVNNNQLQLSHVVGFAKLRADMHDIGLRSGCVDGAMFCYSLCHSDFELALVEAARITKRDGFLFVYDYERISGDNHLSSFRLGFRALNRMHMTELAVDAGWLPDTWENPETDDSLFRKACDNNIAYNEIFKDLRVCAWRMIRR